MNIGSWESAAARDHGVTFLPQLWLYVDGELHSRSTERVLSLLD